jgi:hypothetical protein
MEKHCIKLTTPLGVRRYPGSLVTPHIGRPNLSLTVERVPTDLGDSIHFNRPSSYLNAELVALTLPSTALQVGKH